MPLRCVVAMMSSSPVMSNLQGQLSSILILRKGGEALIKSNTRKLSQRTRSCLRITNTIYLQVLDSNDRLGGASMADY